jgi:hypothetical protein
MKGLRIEASPEFHDFSLRHRIPAGVGDKIGREVFKISQLHGDDPACTIKRQFIRCRPRRYTGTFT